MGKKRKAKFLEEITMEMPERQLPQLNVESFVCPHCKVLALQRWINQSSLSDSVKQELDILYNQKYGPGIVIDLNASSALESLVTSVKDLLTKHFADNYISRDFSFAECANKKCKKFSVWLNSEMIYPTSTPFPDPNEDLEDDIKGIYNEAATIFRYSPRASAALLRLCVEKICKQLGEKANLNTSIGNLVQRGLSKDLQRALDYCRVVGNNAVHAGEIDLSDDPKQAEILFSSINYIAQEMITKPKERKEIYDSLPETFREQINQRDKEKNTRTDE